MDRRSLQTSSIMVKLSKTNDLEQGRTDNSWGPRVIGDHRAPVSLPKLKKAYEKVPGESHRAPY
ncbi:unnamed protein product [Staurois parvus]|uniref:Uncharacterized protein n=1 Tax=Staurois parvus TaxID=386267 RepID=A0ABN9CXM8_9NEOB|nr:unnamed protein product [Staurois parvus]